MNLSKLKRALSLPPENGPIKWMILLTTKDGKVYHRSCSSKMVARDFFDTRFGEWNENSTETGIDDLAQLIAVQGNEYVINDVAFGSIPNTEFLEELKYGITFDFDNTMTAKVRSIHSVNRACVITYFESHLFIEGPEAAVNEFANQLVNAGLTVRS